MKQVQRREPAPIVKAQVEPDHSELQDANASDAQTDATLADSGVQTTTENQARRRSDAQPEPEPQRQPGTAVTWTLDGFLIRAGVPGRRSRLPAGRHSPAVSRQQMQGSVLPLEA